MEAFSIHTVPLASQKLTIAKKKKGYFCVLIAKIVEGQSSSLVFKTVLQNNYICVLKRKRTIKDTTKCTGLHMLG